MEMDLTEINMKNWIELYYLEILRRRFEHNHKYNLHEHKLLFAQFLDIKCHEKNFLGYFLKYLL